MEVFYCLLLHREVIVAGDFNCVLVNADSAVLEEMPVSVCRCY